MNPMPISTARAIMNSFNDALLNNEKSEQSFEDEYKGKSYYETILRKSSFIFDRTNKHDISQFIIEEKSVHSIVRRVQIDHVTAMHITEDDMFLVVDAEPYSLQIALTE